MRIVENVDVVTNVYGKTKAELIFELAKNVGELNYSSSSIETAIGMYDEMVRCGIIKEKVNITKEGN